MTYLLPLACGLAALGIAVGFFYLGRRAGRGDAQKRVERAYELGHVDGSYAATERSVKGALDRIAREVQPPKGWS